MYEAESFAPLGSPSLVADAWLTPWLHSRAASRLPHFS
jgi:hypothetical protein